MSHTTEFKDKVVLVTGSSVGIGRQVAVRFAALGATVAVNSRSRVAEGQAVAEEIGGSYHQADLADEASVVSMIESVVEAHGRLDILVNNAGTAHPVPHDRLDLLTDEMWHQAFGVNVLGTFYASRAALPHLRATGDGCIINIGSIAGTNAIGSSIPYAVSKAGLHHLSVLMANVVGPDVRVNAIAPGLIATPRTESWEGVRTLVEQVAPAAREGTPDDVAEACLYLARAKYVTGDVITVDGGFMLTRPK